MPGLIGEARAHVARREEAESHARQSAALQILCGIDVEMVVAGGAAERAAALSRVERALERERLKGTQRHWSYDLNRHIALKQAHDRLRALDKDKQGTAPDPARKALRKYGKPPRSAREIRTQRALAMKAASGTV